MGQHHYKVDIRWSDEDQIWIARVPELDGVVTHGETVVEAAKMAEEAIELHLESLRAHNEPIPEPVASKKLSGKYPLRMGVERHQDVVIKATQLGLSVNEYLTDLIDRDQKSGRRKVIYAKAIMRNGKKIELKAHVAKKKKSKHA